MTFPSISRTLLLALLLLGASGTAALAVQPGEPAPAFSFTDVRTQEQVSLSDYEGDIVVLVFFWYG